MVVVGVNRFADGSPPPAVEAPRLYALEARPRPAGGDPPHGSGAVESSLADPRSAASGAAPSLMPPSASAPARHWAATRLPEHVGSSGRL